MAEYHDMPLCDLRHLSDPEAIRKIERIHDIAQLILPSDASEEVMSAIAEIPKDDIASILYIPKNTEISIINGMGELNVPAGTERFIMINGVSLIRNVGEDAKLTVNVNGFALIDQNLKEHPGITFGSVNGKIAYCDLSLEPRIYQNKIRLDADTVRYFKSKQVICVGNELVFEADVPLEMLIEKELMIIVGNKLVAPRHLAGYLKATATVGNKIEIVE